VRHEIVPILTEIIRTGIGQGAFAKSDPEATAQIVLSLTTATHDMVGDLFAAESEAAFETAAQRFERYWHAAGLAVDRILGLPEGSVVFVEPGFAAAMFAGWRAKKES
jgi:hypothetical protein